jgi:hypothetical protein
VRRSAQVAPPVLLQKVRPTAQPLGGKSMVLGRPPDVVPLLDPEVEVDDELELDDEVDEELVVVEPPVDVDVVEPPVVEPPVFDVPPHAAPLDTSTARPLNRIAACTLRGMCMGKPPRQGKGAWSVLPQRKASRASKPVPHKARLPRLGYGTATGVSQCPGPLWQAPLMQAPKAGQSLSRMHEMAAHPSSKPHTGPVVVGGPQRWKEAQVTP